MNLTLAIPDPGRSTLSLGLYQREISTMKRHTRGTTVSTCENGTHTCTVPTPLRVRLTLEVTSCRVLTVTHPKRTGVLWDVTRWEW